MTPLTPVTPLLDGTVRRWPLERILFVLAGSMTIVSAALSAAVSPWFLVLTAFAGVNQWLCVIGRSCPTSMLIKRACGVPSVLYPATRSSMEEINA